MKVLLILILTSLLIGCANTPSGLSKEKIQDRERARNARINFYSQVASGIAIGFIGGGYRK